MNTRAPTSQDATSDARTRFTRLYEAYADRVLAYLLRRLPASAAEDVVADTFVVAWRRLDAVPDDPLPWLLVTARHHAARHLRGAGRADAARDRLSTLTRLAGPVDGPGDVVERRTQMLAALAALTEVEREAILLVAWDGLATHDAAHVAGCTPGAFHVRLHRARRHLDELLTEEN